VAGWQGMDLGLAARAHGLSRVDQAVLENEGTASVLGQPPEEWRPTEWCR
jgi:hypothetical protein